METITKSLNLHELREANIRRCVEWNTSGHELSPEFAMMELAGETGEACNVAKKLYREQHGLAGGGDPKELTDHLAEELADVVISASLAAIRYNIDLEQAVINKFNKTSEKRGFKERL